MNLVLEECTREHAHEFLAKQAAKRSLFQEEFWWQVMRDTGLEQFFLGVRRGPHLAAVIPIFRQKRFLLSRVGSPLRGTFTPHIGFIAGAEPLTDGETQAVVPLLSDYLRASGAQMVELGFPSEHALPCLTAHAWQAKQHFTYVLEIRGSEEETWKALQSRARNMVRKAEKSGVRVIRLDGTAAQVDRFHDMLAATFRKSGRRVPHGLAVYRALSRLAKEDHLLFLAAELDGAPVAMGMFPFNASEIHYLSGTSTPAGDKAAANSLIQWEVIRFAAGRGIRLYDLGGAGVASIDRFKESFGGARSSYWRYTWTGRLAGTALRLYERFR